MEENQPNDSAQEKRVAGIPMEGKDDDGKKPDEGKKPDADAGDDKNKKPKPGEEKKPDSPDGGKKNDGSDDEDDSDDEDEDDGNKNSKRPEKYIPIKQYTDEKKKWKQSLKDKDSEISKLTTKVGGDATATKQAEAIKKYAEKHNTDEESVRDLLELFGADLKPKSEEETPKKPDKDDADDEDEDNDDNLSDKQKALIEQGRVAEAQKAYDKEFKTLALPALKNFYPDATDGQLAEAKSEIEKIACTKEFIKKDLDLVVLRSRKALDKIFERKDRKGAEGKREGADAHHATTLSAEDFKDNKTPFTSLADLPAEERNAIVKAFDMRTWNRYKNWVRQSEDLVVKKG